MSKFLLFGLCILLFCPIVFGDVNVSIVEGRNFQCLVGETCESDVLLYNFGSEAVFNFGCYDSEFVSFPDVVDSISGNSEVGLRVVSSANVEVDDYFVTECFFDRRIAYYGDNRTFFINFNNSWSENKVYLRVGDVLNVSNFDTITHNFGDLDGNEFNFVLNPSESVLVTWSEVKDVHFYDSVSGDAGWVYVLNRSGVEFVHDSDDDFNFSFNFNSFFGNSSLLVDLLTDNFVISYDVVKEGVLRLQNVGDLSVLNVSFVGSDDWLSFFYEGVEVTSFDLVSGGERYVNFKLNANITHTVQTNKSYVLPVVIGGSNFVSVVKNVSFFVNHANLSGGVMAVGNDTVYVVNVEATLQYCRDNPNASECAVLNENRTVEIVVVRDAVYQFNFSEDEIISIREYMVNFPESLARVNNLIMVLGDTVNNVNDSANALNDTLVPTNLFLQNETARLREQLSVQAWWFVGLLVIIFGIIFMTWSASETKKDRMRNIEVIE